MRLVLVDNLLLDNGNSGTEDSYLQPHLGLISLIAVANGAGHSALLYNPKLDLARGDLQLCGSLYREIADRLLAQDPDVVGLTSLGCNFICTSKIAAYLKAKSPHLPILLGGPHATILDTEILSRFPQFDVIVRNEAELTLLPVLDAISGRDLGGIPGISYRTGTGVTVNPGEPLIADLDSLPFPAFDSYPLGSLRLPSLRIEAGRGCPFKCSFCSTATFFGRRYRLKSPQRIGAEMDHLRARYGFTHFTLNHDLFTVDRRKVLAFCHYMRGKGYTWDCSARMDCVDDELLAEMAASGCRSIYYGVETGSSRMQKVVDKHLNLGLVEPRLATTRRLEMTATASFITGFPDEEQSDQDDTLDLMGRCFTRHSNGVTVQLHLLTPEPGTALTQRFGQSLEYDGHISDFNFPTLESDDPLVMQSHPAIFMNHHYYPTTVPRRRHVFVTSVYLTLQAFGYPVLAHLVELSGGRFSRLLDDIYRWLAETGRTAPYDSALVCDFIAHRWPHHYLTSVFRFLRTAQALAEKAPPAAQVARGFGGQKGTPPREPRELRLVMTSRAQALRGIHDAPRILERLGLAADGESRPVSQSLQQRRLDFLLFLPEGSSGVQTFELQRGASEVARFLSSPRSFTDLRELARSLGGDPDEAVACGRHLFDLGVLVDASDQERPPRPALNAPTQLGSSALASSC